VVSHVKTGLGARLIVTAMACAMKACAFVDPVSVAPIVRVICHVRTIAPRTETACMATIVNVMTSGVASTARNITRAQMTALAMAFAKGQRVSAIRDTATRTALFNFHVSPIATMVFASASSVFAISVTKARIALEKWRVVRASVAGFTATATADSFVSVMKTSTAKVANMKRFAPINAPTTAIASGERVCAMRAGKAPIVLESWIRTTGRHHHPVFCWHLARTRLIGFSRFESDTS